MNEQAQTMKRDAELYTYIYQNARMGLVGINQVRGTVSDAELTKELCDEYAMYDEYSTTAENALRDLGEESKDIGAIAKMGVIYLDKDEYGGRFHRVAYRCNDD